MRLIAGHHAQSLIETALAIPVILVLACYAVDVGYFYIVAGCLSASANDAAEYSIQGFSSPSQATLPAAGSLTTNGSVASLALADLADLYGSSVSTTIQVCSPSVGTANNTPQCATYGASSSSFAADTDPESPTFLLNRVDVVYTVRPPIPVSLLPGFPFFSLFGSLASVPTQFHRSMEMRAIN